MNIKMYICSCSMLVSIYNVYMIFGNVGEIEITRYGMMDIKHTKHADSKKS